VNFKSRIAAGVACLLLICTAHAAETIKIAHIDPMSGPFGLVGESFGRHLDAAAAEINAKEGVLGGTQFVIAHFDNKSSPQDSVQLLKQITDSGIRYLTQGAGSNVAHALSEAIAKHNSRNPDASVLYFNFAA
jgi:branched-chain amino acid transport system substrate-binding protein